MRSSGFTLLEMLLAMVVIAVVGITISTATGNVASQTFTLERRTMAHWVGQNQINRLRLSLRGDNSELPEGKDTVRVYMGERDWQAAARKAEKSCSPMKYSAAARMASRSSGCRTHHARCRSSAERTGRFRIR